MALSNAPKTTNINENWLFNFTADNSECLEFDGTDDHVSFGNVLGLYTNFTLEAWIKPDVYSSSSGTQVIIERGNDGSTSAKNTNFQLALRHNGLRVKYQYGTGQNVANTVTTSAITANNWHHVAATRDDANSILRYYVDGVEIGTSTSNVSNRPSGGGSGVVNIGANFEQAGDFDGEIAHVRVWNSTRTAAQIAYYYKRLIDSTALGVQGYWKLNEGNGTTVSDFSGNNNSGTINNAAWSINGFTEFIHAFNLSFRDTVVDTYVYHGNVLNKGIVIRESINITNGTSSTSNITLKCANINLYSSELYKIIFNGTNNYLNRNVQVYAQYQHVNALSECQQIFTGKIVDIKVDQNKILTLQINSQRPWENIEFPQTKTDNNIYQPVVYGDYDPNLDQGLVRNFSNLLFPAPFKHRGTTTDHLIIVPTSSTNIYPHYYDRSADAFLPIKSDNYTAATKNQEAEFDANVNIGLVNRELRRRFRLNATSLSSDGSTSYTNAKNLLLNSYNSGGIAHTFVSSQSASVKNFFANFAVELSKVNDSDFDILGSVITPNQSGNVALTLRINFSGSSGDFFNGNIPGGYNNISLTDGSLSNSNAVSDNSYATLGFSLSDNNFNTVNLSSTISSTGANRSLELLITDFLVYLDIQESFEDSAGRTSISMNNTSSMDHLYLGTNGLPESYTGGSTPIAWGIEAFRDLLVRFAGHRKSAPIGFTSLYHDRRTSAGGTNQNNWKIRYWQLEPIPLKNILDKMAYEFGFVYKFAADGDLKLIHVLQTSEYNTMRTDGDVLEITKFDIKNINVSTTGLDEVITKMTINNNPHPAINNRYYNTVTSENSTIRKKYNHGEKQNIANVDLDMNVGTAASTPASDCNADFYSYYDNIIGDFKIIVTCDVVNMVKGAQLETGDIINFTNMPVDAFDDAFNTSKYFMIVETKRSLGKINITAREVG